MKLHSIFISVLLLATGYSARAMEESTTPVDLKAQLQAHVLASDAIIMRAKLIHLLERMVKKGTVQELLAKLDQEFPLQTADEQTTQLLQTILVEQAQVLRSQKITQLQLAMSKSKIWAGIKAGICTWIACQRVRGAPTRENSNNLLSKLCWDHLIDAIVYGDCFTLETSYLLSDLTLLCISSTWAYENAHFAYYGNSLLIAEIKKLDEIITTVGSGNIPSSASVEQSAPGYRDGLWTQLK